MPSFALLVLESSNRVYADRATELLGAELLAVAAHMRSPIDAARVETLGGVDYVVFDSDELDDHDRFIVSNLSGARALFRIEGEALRPLDVIRLAYFPSDLVTIQRYPGKTNEQFTHLLLNVTIAASTAAAERSGDGMPVRVLDPVAGRGTTLNRALTCGYDATGVEVSPADYDQYRTFVTTYLKDHRVKHKRHEEKIRKGDLAGTNRYTLTIRGSQRLEIVQGDTELAADLFSPRSFDVVVGDLPYGIQHRSSGGGANSRSPHDLLDASLDGWRQVMRNGAAIGLAWNTKTLPRDDGEQLLSEHGFDLVEHPRSFKHVVDRSITRDLVVAVKRRG